MICYSCGNQIEDNLIICPCCGAVQPNRSVDMQYQQDGAGNMNYRKTKYNITCVFGCILSCVGFLSTDVFMVLGILPIAGIIISIIGLNNINANVEQGKVLAILGIILGAVQILIKILILVTTILV